jgi:hypothetical protein
MSTFRKSVPKPAPGAGAPKGKNPFLKIVFVADILEWPLYDGNGVKMLGDIVLKDGAKIQTLYLTDDTQKISFTTEGESDAEGFLKKFEGKHPGDSLEKSEFVQNTIGQPLVLIYDSGCADTEKRVLGDACNPLYLKAELTDDKDGLGTMFVFEQRIRDRKVPGFYSGSISIAENFVATTSAVPVTTANGNIYRLPAVTVADTDVTFSSMSLAHGQILSLVGGGGAEPSTLASGVNGSVIVLLKDDTSWTALKDATISLQVFDAGAVTYLIEVART